MFMKENRKKEKKRRKKIRKELHDNRHNIKVIMTIGVTQKSEHNLYLIFI